MSGWLGTSGHSAVLTLIIAVVLVVVAGAAVPPAAANPSELGEPHPSPAPGAQATTDANATPIQHENPDEVERAGDLPEVEEWLADRLSERLSQSATNLSEEQYERAKELLGEQYSFHLERHRTVSDETNSDEDDDTSESFATTSETQREFIEAVQDYRETYESFEEAQRLGDRRSQRRLGSALEDKAERVNETGRRLNQTYTVLEVRSSRSFSESRSAVETVVTDVTDTQAQVRERFFTETRITATADRRVISFTRPLGVSGRLVTANGTPIPDQRVSLQAGEVSRQARTDVDGRYRIVYRPVRLPLSAQNVTLVFEPGPESQYLDSRTTVPIEVRQSTPEIGVSDWPESAAYRDEVEVFGTVTVNGTPVSGVPVVLSVGDNNLRETLSGPGGFRAQGQLSLGVPPGNQPLRVELPLENQSIAGVSIENQIRIETAPTTLRLRAADAGNGEVDVEGRLVAHESIVVSSVSIRFRIEDTVVGTVRTTQTGAFATTFSVPQELLSEEAVPVTVRATFDPSGTNLEPASAEATAVVTPPANEELTSANTPGLFDQVSGWFDQLSTAQQLGLVLGGSLLVGGIVLFRRGLLRLITQGQVEISLEALRERLPRLFRGSDPTDSVGGVQGSDPDTATDADATEDPGQILLDRAERAFREDNTDVAVTTAYAAVRGTYGSHLDVSPSRTHWEFLADCGSNGFDEETMALLHELTVEYERAAFAAEPADRAMAADAIDRAKQLMTSVGSVESA